MADQLARAKQRETKLTQVFTAIDAMEAAETALGVALRELRDLGVPQADLADMTGLSSREVGAALKAAESDEDAPAEHTSSVTEQTEASNNGEDETHQHQP